MNKEFMKSDFLEKDDYISDNKVVSANDIEVIYLIGGGSKNLAPINYTQPSCLLSINQRPAIFNTITKLVKEGLDKITFVVSPFDKEIIKEFIQKSFPKINARFKIQKKKNGTLKALLKCYNIIKSPVLVLFGNTQCDFTIDYDNSFMGIIDRDTKGISGGNYKLDVSNNGEINCVYNLDEDAKFTHRAAGVFYFRDYHLLKTALNRFYSTVNGEYDLSALLKYYNSKEKFKAIKVENWSNSKELSCYVEALRSNLNGRCFNSFVVDEFGIMEKTSTEPKLKTEMAWYDEISKSDVSFLCPHYLYGTTKEENLYSYKLEFMEYLSLAEYFVYYPIPTNTWIYIIKMLIKTASRLWTCKNVPQDFNIKERAKKMYIDKTFDRIAKWDRQDLLDLEEVIINGKKYIGARKCLELLNKRLNNLVENSEKYVGVIHGDMCMSNILYAPKSSIFKLIDPRGDFGGPTIFGDIRYDIAKLRHNYHGMYDYITSDLFNIKQINKNTFNYSFYTNEIPEYLKFDQIFVNQNFDIDDIELIEGLLFISMIPLHRDKPLRQLMFFLTALKCFNNQLGEE
ncbi:MAG: sugar phosphate nucleotidyltransferase [Christensenellales bacterium]